MGKVGGIRNTYLDRFGVCLDLSPAHRFIWSSAGIAAIELLRGVHVDCVLGPISHEACVSNVVLDNTTTQDDHAGPGSSHSHGVDTAHIIYNVNPQSLWGRLKGVEVEHVAQGAISQSWTEYGDSIPGGPVQDRILVVDLTTQTLGDAAGCPVQLVLRIPCLPSLLFGRLLFL